MLNGMIALLSLNSIGMTVIHQSLFFILPAIIFSAFPSTWNGAPEGAVNHCRCPSEGIFFMLDRILIILAFDIFHSVYWSGACPPAEKCTLLVSIQFSSRLYFSFFRRHAWRRALPLSSGDTGWWSGLYPFSFFPLMINYCIYLLLSHHSLDVKMNLVSWKISLVFLITGLFLFDRYAEE